MEAATPVRPNVDAALPVPAPALAFATLGGFAIADGHGGRVSVVGRPGGGTVFTVELRAA